LGGTIGSGQWRRLSMKGDVRPETWILWREVETGKVAKMERIHRLEEWDSPKQERPVQVALVPAVRVPQ
jgi:hypothetical protein